MFVTLLIWNVALAALMAAFVMLAGRTRYLRERPALRHCLWLFVLCKLVTPPLVPLPVSLPAAEKAIPDFAETIQPETSTPDAATHERGGDSVVFNSDAPSSVADNGSQEDVQNQFDSGPRSTDGIQSATATRPINWIVVLLLISLVVTVVLVVRVFVQLRKLSCLLRRGDCGSSIVNTIADREARRMGIRKMPSVCVVNSAITPLLWVKQGRPVVVVPNLLLSRFTGEQIACVVAHELAHFVRRDHWSNGFACLVGYLFWWNPMVCRARRELRVAQEACCDAMVIDGTPTVRRTYAETLLQVIELVGGKRSAPQLTTGFGEMFSITRRFEMIANERVTHRLSRPTGLLVAALFGLAYCYPVLAQPPSDRDLDLADRSTTFQGENYCEEALGIKYEFHWIPRYVATAKFEYFDNAKKNGVLTLRAERYPKSALTEMLKSLHDAKNLRITRITTESPEHGSELINVILESEPFSAAMLAAVITDVSKHFRIKQMILSPAKAVEPTQQDVNEDLEEWAKEFNSGIQRSQEKQLENELLGAIRSVLPRDVDDTGWQIELQGYHYYSTNAVPHRASLDGHWIVRRVVHGRPEHVDTAHFKHYAWTFDAVARTLTTQWSATSEKSSECVSRFVENTSTTPKQLTVYGENSLLQAIYKINGDTLRIAVFGKPELGRPSSFEAPSSSEAGPLVVFELERFVGPSRR